MTTASSASTLAKSAGGRAEEARSSAVRAAATAELAVGDANRLADEAQLRIAALEPRSLSKEQIAKMSTFLGKRGTWPLEIEEDMQSFDAGEFGTEIKSVFDANGWKPREGVAVYGGKPIGLWVTAGGTQDSMLGGEVIKDAFHEAGIAVRLVVSQDARTAPTDSITLHVGFK